MHLLKDKNNYLRTEVKVLPIRLFFFSKPFIPSALCTPAWRGRCSLGSKPPSPAAQSLLPDCWNAIRALQRPLENTHHRFCTTSNSGWILFSPPFTNFTSNYFGKLSLHSLLHWVLGCVLPLAMELTKQPPPCAELLPSAFPLGGYQWNSTAATTPARPGESPAGL